MSIGKYPVKLKSIAFEILHHPVYVSTPLCPSSSITCQHPYAHRHISTLLNPKGTCIIYTETLDFRVSGSGYRYNLYQQSKTKYQPVYIYECSHQHVHILALPNPTSYQNSQRLCPSAHTSTLRNPTSAVHYYSSVNTPWP